MEEMSKEGRALGKGEDEGKYDIDEGRKEGRREEI